MIELNNPINFAKLCNIMPNWTWQELTFAFVERIIGEDDIILYAKKIIDDDANFDLVLELIINEEYIIRHEILEILLKINLNEKFKQKTEEVKSKWIFACVYYEYTYYESIYQAIEDIWCKFDYTEELEHMIGWIPYREDNPNHKIAHTCRLETYILNGKNKYGLS